MKGIGLYGLVIGLVISSFAAKAFAWGHDGHELITEGAVTHLPPPLYAYFHGNVARVAASAGVEPPGSHYIDIDYYPEFFAGTFPHDKSVLIALYGSSVVNANGVAPWTAGDYVVTLTSAMAAARTSRDWLALLNTAGPLAHYAEDLHNPLHLTENYNGQLTGNTGIHSRYESQMISRHLNDLIITSTPAACVFLASPVDTIFDTIDAHYPYVQSILTADTLSRGQPPTYNEAYYTAMWIRTGGFTDDLFQQASELTASVWYTAWVNAGSPAPIFAGDFDVDGDVDLDDFTRFRTCFNGPNRSPAKTNCTDIDLDGDSDVDLDDFTIFRACFNGPNHAPSCQ